MAFSAYLAWQLYKAESRRREEMRRERLGQCIYCGMDLKGAVHHCPWCGAPRRRTSTVAAGQNEAAGGASQSGPTQGAPAADLPRDSAPPVLDYATAERQPVVVGCLLWFFAAGLHFIIGFSCTGFLLKRGISTGGGIADWLGGMLSALLVPLVYVAIRLGDESLRVILWLGINNVIYGYLVMYLIGRRRRR